MLVAEDAKEDTRRGRSFCEGIDEEFHATDPATPEPVFLPCGPNPSNAFPRQIWSASHSLSAIRSISRVSGFQYMSPAFALRRSRIIRCTMNPFRLRSSASEAPMKPLDPAMAICKVTRASSRAKGGQGMKQPARATRLLSQPDARVTPSVLC